MLDTGSNGPSSAEQGLGAFRCDGAGGIRVSTFAAADVADGSPGWAWYHLDHADPAHRTWLREQSGLDAVSCSALLATETRPRLVCEDDHLLVILRGVNLNPGAEPDDMISLRLWIEAGRVISLRHRRLLAVQDVRAQMQKGGGPRTPAELLVAITTRVVERQGIVVEALEDTVDDVEEQLVGQVGHALRSAIAELRRQAIGLRRYLAPQRDVLTQLSHVRVGWLDAELRGRLREVGEHQVRLVEEIDAARERASVAQEELNGRLSEQMNRNMYVLSVVAGVFLPLGLLTGLLGINVGGMPGVDNPLAFWVVCALLALLAVLMIWMFRRARLM